MRKESWVSLIGLIVGLALQGAAWILDDVPQATRVLLAGLSLVPFLLVMLAQGMRSRGVRSRLAAFVMVLRVHSPLLIGVILSLGALLAVNRTIGVARYLTEVVVSCATVVLSASLFSLLREFGTQPSLRAVKGSADDVYLVRDGVGRKIPDAQTVQFVLLDTYREVECISDTELKMFRDGPPVPSISSCRLVRGLGPAIYLVWEGCRKHIPDPATFKCFFSGRQVDSLADAELERIPRTGALRSILSTTPAISVDGNAVINIGPKLP